MAGGQQNGWVGVESGDKSLDGEGGRARKKCQLNPILTPFPVFVWLKRICFLDTLVVMNFRFNLSKATEAACLFLERGGGHVNVMKLVKLMYLLDRLSLDRRNSPVSGGDYLSMRNGPVTSEVLDLINAGRLIGESDRRWEQCVSNRTNHDVKLEKMPARDHLSDAEVSLLDEIWAEHGGKDQWQLVDWCHNHCKEWVPLTNGCAPIAVEQVAIALGKSPAQVNRLRQEAIELNQLDEIFAGE